MDKTSPLILFVYNRPQHTKKTLEALKKCDLANNTELFIFSDAPREEIDIDRVNQVRNIVSEVKGFKSVKIIMAEHNKGLAQSIIDGVSKIIEIYDKAIVLEDDCVVSPYFLSFMNNALNFYKDDKKVGSISGYSPPINIPTQYKHDVYLVPRNCSMSWATWKDRWEKIDWECKDFYDINLNLSFAKKFNQAGSDRFLRLHRQLLFNKQSWSIRFGYSQFVQGYATIYPLNSYVRNIGSDGSGTHKENSFFLDVTLNNAIPFPYFEQVDIDCSCVKLFHRFYSGNFLGNFKRFLISLYEIFRFRKNHN